MSSKLLVLPGMEEMGKKVLPYLQGQDFHGMEVTSERTDFRDGTNKVKIGSGVEASKLFILIDPYNYSATYRMRDVDYPMCPDKHMFSLLRAISAIRNDAEITVIMPLMYDGRQDKRIAREDLMAAEMLQSLERAGVKRIVTYDIHSEGLQNAIPRTALENLSTRKILTKAFMKDHLDVKSSDVAILGTDEGALKRASKMARDVGPECIYATCGKLRSESEQPGERDGYIEKHELFGNVSQLRGKHILITDDILDSGNTIIDVLYLLKGKKCKTVNILISFGLFTKGIEDFQKAHDEGLFQFLYATDLTYLDPKIKAVSWVKVAESARYLSDAIKAISHNDSLSDLF